MNNQIIRHTRRITTPFIQAIPDIVEHFDAILYAVVDRKPEKVVQDNEYGTRVRIDPCILDWQTKTITMYIPTNINCGIDSIDDLDPNFYESVEAAFLALLQSCIP